MRRQHRDRERTVDIILNLTGPQVPFLLMLIWCCVSAQTIKSSWKWLTYINRIKPTNHGLDPFVGNYTPDFHINTWLSQHIWVTETDSRAWGFEFLPCGNNRCNWQFHILLVSDNHWSLSFKPNSFVQVCLCIKLPSWYWKKLWFFPETLYSKRSLNCMHVYLKFNCLEWKKLWLFSSNIDSGSDCFHQFLR